MRRAARGRWAGVTRGAPCTGDLSFKVRRSRRAAARRRRVANVVWRVAASQKGAQIRLLQHANNWWQVRRRCGRDARAPWKHADLTAQFALRPRHQEARGARASSRSVWRAAARRCGRTAVLRRVQQLCCFDARLDVASTAARSVRRRHCGSFPSDNDVVNLSAGDARAAFVVCARRHWRHKGVRRACAVCAYVFLVCVW